MTQTKNHDSFWERVLRLFRSHLGPDSDPHKQPVNPLVELLQPLDLLRHQALVEQFQAREASVQQESQDEQDSLRQEQMALRADIMKLHAKLNTGLSESMLEQMGESLREHCRGFRAPRPDELSEISMLSVMARFHKESLEWAWQEFEKRLQNAGLAWPEPTGLAPQADEIEVAEHRRLHRQKLYAAFVGGPFLRFADLIIGVVPVWRTLYPQRGGAVWIESVYEAVAGALACRRLAQLEALAERDREILERLISEVLAGQLAPLQQRLTAGVGSVAEARNLSDQAISLCQQSAPEVVWNHLSRQLDRM